MAATTCLSHLECARTGARHDADARHHLSRAGAPLLARYRLDEARSRLTPDALRTRPFDLWRYREVLPVRDDARRVILGEGGTPLLETPRIAGELGLRKLFVKDESRNPTGSFKARGLAVAVSRALELGARELSLPSAGNAAGALAAYASRAGVPAHVFVPHDAPRATTAEARAFGADVRLVDGLIDEAGRAAREAAEREGWYELATLQEPYRVEGKKTMAYELVEQLGRAPDVILYPTGGGTGLVGMWKAFGEMEELGWIGDARPRMIAVQSEGCAPIVSAFEAGRDSCVPWPNASTVAPGLRVPRAFGDFLILEALYASNGRAVAVADEALVEAARRLAREEAVAACPEAGACLAALEVLVSERAIDEDETVVLFNTASAAKYEEVLGGAA